VIIVPSDIDPDKLNLLFTKLSKAARFNFKILSRLKH
jgi:hypothetical protein